VGARGSEAQFRRKEKQMKAIVNRAKQFLKSEDGPTATEYAVMLALIIVVCIATVKSIGTKANTAFKAVDDNL
jgi:pilus assembly protein Flp/PilA